MDVQQYSLQEAQAQLKKLIAEAQHGEMVLILDDQNHLIQLVPIEPSSSVRKPRQAGNARGQITMAPDFDAPLDDFNEYME